MDCESENFFEDAEFPCEIQSRSLEAPLSFLAVIRARSQSARSPSRAGFDTPLVAKTLLLAVIALACAGGMLATDSAATAQAIASAGADWANLLRAMAALKLLFAGAATAAVLWRLGAPVSAPRWGAYALAAAAAWAGPGLIWGLAHIVLGALLLHGGLIAMAALVWRDPATRAGLSEIIARRRAASRTRR
jgi:hypothetical protein